MAAQRVLVVFGTRPEVIKLAPVVMELRARKSAFECIACSTGQHREMLDQALSVFRIKPDVDLRLMTPGQSLGRLTSLLFQSIDRLLEEWNPDALIVQGDTTSAYVAAMCAFYRGIPVGHVEAGLRTGDISAPFPEEANRCIIGKIASQHYAPTQRAKSNLLREGVSEAAVEVTGNTVVDALHWMQKSGSLSPGEEIPAQIRGLFNSHRLVLVTSHRRESFGQGLSNICRALFQIVTEHPDTIIVYPVHLNPNVSHPVQKALGAHPRIHLLPPVSYPALLWLMSQAYLVISDSGGIQEEAPSFSKPLLVLREITERPEAVEAGCAELVGTDAGLISRRAGALLDDLQAYRAMANKENPFGDGMAARRIADMLMRQIKTT